MIDKDKWGNSWDGYNYKERFEFVKALFELANFNAISKDDWEFICEFLIEYCDILSERLGD